MRLKKMYRLFLFVLTLFFFACSQGPNHPRGNWGHMMGYGYGGGFMWLLFLVIAGVAIYSLLQNSKSIKSIESPLDILKKRYAKGEIDRGEFDRIKTDLEEL